MRRARLHVERVGLELDPLRAAGERVPEQQELGGGIDRRALRLAAHTRCRRSRRRHARAGWSDSRTGPTMRARPGAITACGIQRPGLLFRAQPIEPRAVAVAAIGNGM